MGRACSRRWQIRTRFRWLSRVAYRIKSQLGALMKVERTWLPLRSSDAARTHRPPKKENEGERFFYCADVGGAPSRFKADREGDGAYAWRAEKGA